MNFLELYHEFQWFFALGYVTVISVVATMLLVNLWKITFLKKCLVNADANKKDRILSWAGTITSLVIYAIVFFANEMILQKTFFITIQWGTAAMSLPSGAAVTWVAAKGLYTVLHKLIGRLKDKKLSKKELEATKQEINEVEQAVNNAKNNTPSVITTQIGSTEHKNTKNTKKIL